MRIGIITQPLHTNYGGLIGLDSIEKKNLLTPIDWEKINAIKKEWQKKSVSFIKENLETI